LHFCMAAIDGKFAPEEVKLLRETLSAITWSKHGEKAEQKFSDEEKKFDEAWTHYQHCFEKEILGEECCKAAGEIAKNLGVFETLSCFNIVGTEDYWNPNGLEIIYSSLALLARTDGEIDVSEHHLLSFIKGLWKIKNKGDSPEKIEKFDKLIEQLKDEDWHTRKAAVESLGDLPYEAGISPLIQIQQDDDHQNVKESAKKALEKLAPLLPPKPHTQIYEIAKKKYSDIPLLISMLNIFDEMMIFQYDMTFPLLTNRTGIFDWDETSKIDVDVIHKTESHGKQARINGVDFGDTDENGLHDSSYYGEHIIVLPETEFGLGHMWIVRTESSALTTRIEKILVDGKDVKNCKAIDKPKLILRNIAMTQNGPSANFLFLFNYIFMFDKIHSEEGSFGTAELIEALNSEGIEILNSYYTNEIIDKRFFLDEKGIFDLYKFKKGMAKAQSDSIEYMDSIQYLRFAGFDSEDQIQLAAGLVANYFKYNPQILGELYGILYMTATRDGKINSSEKNFLALISNMWL